MSHVGSLLIGSSGSSIVSAALSWKDDMALPHPIATRRRLTLVGVLVGAAALLSATSLSPAASAAPQAGSPLNAAAAVQAPAPGTVVIDENFDGLTALPPGWTAQNDGWSVANGVLNQTSTEDTRVVTFGPHLNNFKFEGDLTFTGGDVAGAWAGFGIDAEGAAPFWQLGINRQPGAAPYLDIAHHTADGGWQSNLGTGTITASDPMPDGQTVHVEVDVWDNRVEGYLNGQHLISYDKVTRSTDGTLDLATGWNATATFDNIKVTSLSGFATDSYTTPTVSPGAQVSQSLTGLWNGTTAPTGFTKLSGSPWLSVSDDGVVTGTAPLAADQTGTITVQATDGSSTSQITVDVPVHGAVGRFVTDQYTIPAVPAGGSVRQVVSGLWDGTTPVGYTKVSGDSWLSVSDDGVVTGTAPSDGTRSGTITVANGNSTASTLTITVPVLGRNDRQQITAASWNLYDDGSHVDDALAKELAVVADSRLDVIGVQESDGTGARALADALGWYSYQSSGDLGIVSAYPVSAVTPPTSSTPAAGVTLTVNGHRVRVWTAHLDEADYGPDRAAAGAKDLVEHEKTTVRYAQATAIANEIAPDIAAAKKSATPTILLGDLASPSGKDGKFDWPVPDVFAHAGLTDSLRAAYPRAASRPGYTYNLLATGGATDRIDYVDYAGQLGVIDAESLYTGRPQPGSRTNQWVSDHAAAVTLFQFGD